MKQEQNVGCKNKMEECYVATLVGCAIGDTLGMAVEAMKREQIQKYVGKITEPLDPVLPLAPDGSRLKEDEYGSLKGWTRNLRKGMYTDDTILTLALAESLVEAGMNVEKVAEKQLAAYLAQPAIDGKRRSGAFGGTTLEGFANLEKGISAYKSGVIGGPGNAPAMKMSPLGLYMDATGKYEEGLQFAEAVGRITHLDPRSVASGVVQAHAVYVVLNDVSREEFFDSIVAVCKKYEKPVTAEFPLYNKGNLTSRLEWIANHKDAEDAEAQKTLGSSSLVFQSYPFAVFMFQKYWNNPVEGLIETVNYGGDCDTTGAMYGVLAGAMNGMVFPFNWLNGLQNSDKIVKLGQKMYELTGR